MALPKLSTGALNIYADPPSDSATSPTTSPAASSKPEDSDPNYTLNYEEPNNLEFDFTPVTYSMRDTIAKSLSIADATDLNVVRIVVALPLTATVTNTQTVSPTITKGDKHVYYTWNTDKDRTDIRLIGTMPLSNSTDTPSGSSSPTTSQSAGVAITPTPLAVKHKDSNTTLYIALGITAAVATAGIVITILLTQKRRQPTAKYPSSVPSSSYNSQGYTGNQPQQGYPTSQNWHP